MQVAVILPSRGLAFSQTIEEVYRELLDAQKRLGISWKVYWSHARKVPDCLNVPTNQALRLKSNTHFWYVDDDMILPKGILVEMLEANKHAIVADYPCTITMGAVLYDRDGRAYFGGNGCLLVKRQVLESLQKPIWRSDIGWQIRYHNDYVEFVAGTDNPDKVYGRHDVHFGLRLYAKGQALYVTNMVCGQRKLRQVGDFTTNLGAHDIMEWRTFHPNVFYIIDKQWTRDIADPNGMVYCTLDDGTEAWVRLEHAMKLIDLKKLKLLGFAKFTNWDIQKEQIKNDEND